jgi:hypothetical protein
MFGFGARTSQTSGGLISSFQKTAKGAKEVIGVLELNDSEGRIAAFQT